MTDQDEDAKAEDIAVGETRLRALAQVIEQALPAGLGFALHIFTWGGGHAGYISNARREDMVRALREAADTLEAGADSPPGSNTRRH